jgi:short-subunit dehydrogenase
VVTASLAGLVPMPADPLYTLTKTAVVGYVRAVAPALAGQGVTVTALCPGFADTAILGSMRDELVATLPLLTADDVGDAFLALLDGGKPGEAWFVQPGREPGPYVFRGVPGPRS